IDECKVAGGPKGHHCSDNTVCVNTQGSYRCDCLKGYSRQDSSECKGTYSSVTSLSVSPALTLLLVLLCLLNACRI
ncbi:protein kinase C-binding protein NELL1, partial [Biomphalaria glabrata]